MIGQPTHIETIEGARLVHLGVTGASFRWDDDPEHALFIDATQLQQGLSVADEGELHHYRHNGHGSYWSFAPYPQANALAPVGLAPSDLLDLSDVGATFIREPTRAEWDTIVQSTIRIHFRLPFIIGDLINHGVTRWGATYDQAIEATGRQYSTLASYAWVCRQVPIAIRRDDLTFEHHKRVAKSALSIAEKQRWLALAAQGKFENTATMGEAIAADLAETHGLPVEVYESVGCPFCGDRSGWRLARLHAVTCTCGAHGEELATRVTRLEVDLAALRQAHQELQARLDHAERRLAELETPFLLPADTDHNTKETFYV